MRKAAKPKISVIPGFAERLRSAVDGAGGPTVVSKASDIPLSTLNDYLKGGDARLSKISKISAACGASLDWLATGTEKGDIPDIAILRPDALGAPARFWALAVLIRTAQDYFERMNVHSPTLLQVLSWMSLHYAESASTPDTPFEIVERKIKLQ